MKVLKYVRSPKTVQAVPLIDVSSLIKSLKKAQKVRPILGVPAELAIGSVKKLVRLAAIEGYEAMQDGSWIVKGEIGEPWFIDSKKLFKSYSPESTDSLGWTKFQPKPEAWRWATLVEFPNGFAIHALYGEVRDGTFSNGIDRYIQFSKGQAAYVVNNPDDPNDYWLVVPSLFLATYNWL